MKNYKLIIISFIMVFSTTFVASMSIDYYYHPSCGHCQKIHGFILNSVDRYSSVNWNMYDTSLKRYDVDGTPMMLIKTDDCREISLYGSYEIPKYMECEINEQSNINCETLSAYENNEVTWFIR